MHTPHDTPATKAQMAEILSEFDHHDCTLQFANARERLKKREK